MVYGMRRRRRSAVCRCRHQVRAQSSGRRTAFTSTSPCRRQSRPDRGGPCWCGCTTVHSWAVPAVTTALNNWRSGVTRSSSRSTTGWGRSATSATPGWAPPHRSAWRTNRPPCAGRGRTRSASAVIRAVSRCAFRTPLLVLGPAASVSLRAHRTRTAPVQELIGPVGHSAARVSSSHSDASGRMAPSSARACALPVPGLVPPPINCDIHDRHSAVHFWASWSAGPAP